MIAINFEQTVKNFLEGITDYETLDLSEIEVDVLIQHVANELEGYEDIEQSNVEREINIYLQNTGFTYDDEAEAWELAEKVDYPHYKEMYVLKYNMKELAFDTIEKAEAYIKENDVAYPEVTLSDVKYTNRHSFEIIQDNETFEYEKGKLEKVEDMKCNICETGEMEHKQLKKTHVYICVECPNVQLEYSFYEDIENLSAYLRGELEPLTEEEQMEYILAEFLGFHSYDGNSEKLSHEVKLLINNNEEIHANVSETYRLNGKQDELMEKVIDSLLIR